MHYLLAMHQPVGDPPPPEVLGPIMDALDAVEHLGDGGAHARRLRPGRRGLDRASTATARAWPAAGATRDRSG